MSDDHKKVASEYEKKHVTKGDQDTKRDVEMLGIAYTPREIVDFMVRSVDDILKAEFGTDLGSERVDVFDPFTGTGRFLVGLVESDRISDDDIKRKYQAGEIKGQEILPDSYEIAKKSIENAYLQRIGSEEEFQHLRLGDTFQDGESFYADLEERNKLIMDEIGDASARLRGGAKES